MSATRAKRPFLSTLTHATAAPHAAGFGLAITVGCALAWPAFAQNRSETASGQSLTSQARTTLPRHVLQTLEKAQVPPSALSVLIAPLPQGTASISAQPRHLSHQAQASVNPASVMKLFTTYAGLSLLGPDHVWRNRVYTDGPVRVGVLQGNLVIRGSGDPKLVVERLQDL